MDKIKFKAIISDFDGTLAGKDSIISLKVQLAIKKWVSSGRIFAIATGRQFPHIKDACDLLELNSPQIVRGGAEIIDAKTNQIIWSEYLAEDDVRKIVQLLLVHRIPFHAEKGNSVFSETGEFIEGYEGLIFKKLNEMNYRDIPRILIWSNDVISESFIENFIETQIKDKFTDIHIIKAHTPYKKSWDITSQKASKHLATLELSKLLEIDCADIVGIGDSYNDYPLLIACGYKVAMGNAPDQLKSIADFIAPDYTDNGVAVAIKHILKISEK